MFARIHGNLSVNQYRNIIDRLCNSFVAAWLDGKNGFDTRLAAPHTEHADVRPNESNLLATVKMLLGADPGMDCRGKMGDSRLARGSWRKARSTRCSGPPGICYLLRSGYAANR